MPGYLIVEQHILQLRATTNVMNDHRAVAHFAVLIGNDPDVWKVSRQHPRHQIAGTLILSFGRYL